MNASDAKAYCDTQDSSCIFVETSAKKNANVDNLFYELFNVANLPPEMAPNHTSKRSVSQTADHRGSDPCGFDPSGLTHSNDIVSANGTDLVNGSTTGVIPSIGHQKKTFLHRQNHAADTCSVVTTNVCRPSLRTDLMIMQSKTSHMAKDNKTPLSLSLRPIQRSHCSLQ